MQCASCGADTPGGRCPYCGTTAPGGAPSAYGAGAQPTAMDAEYRMAMGQPTANDPSFQAAVGQATANDPSFQAAMGQPHAPPGIYMATPPSPYGDNPYGSMVGQGTMPVAKRGCCGCLSVMMMALAAGGGVLALLVR